MYTNVTDSFITLAGGWSQDDIKSAYTALSIAQDCEKFCYEEIGTYLPISVLDYYGILEEPYKGAINTCGSYLILKENIHPLVKCMMGEYDNPNESSPLIIGENIEYVDEDFFFSHNWVRRKGYVILTSACVNYIFSHFDDINSIDDINKILHTNFDTLGESYISHSILYEGVNLQAKNKSKFNDEPFDEWSFIPVKLENRIIDMNDINKEGE